ncbi:RNA polymerase sigma factor [Halalkalibacter akibai]|uniref:RNA polymerase sigma-70 factor n=1 Tax=Halalkalibacter akibai (strain ATCC 43226 / DSM 21942 / CIP 109018 / JCM 9157 / 1139) TaxID=1236973 RepID=W4QST5_HALA3|nr:RNA polymerase sigma factor [Halalkalibacter akibai]GAE35161.1 RNA polymerase sigma-70 factor [Halalkalibacter akibai JCM 9157]
MSGNKELEEDIRRLYGLYFNDVYRFIASFINNRNDIEDLTQEVFMRLFKSLSTYKGQSEMKTWLFSIAKNVTFDHLRKVKRQNFLYEYLLKWLPNQQQEKLTEDVVTRKEEVSALYSHLKDLKYDYRMVVLLRGVHELSIIETAKIMDWTESKVKVTYHRALKILKKELEATEEMAKERWIDNG